jgi:hypothetical protein
MRHVPTHWSFFTPTTNGTTAYRVWANGSSLRRGWTIWSNAAFVLRAIASPRPFYGWSRATLFPGQYLARHQAPKLDKTGWYDQWNETWPALLQRNADYCLGHIGKWQYHKMEFILTVLNGTRLFEGSHYYHVKGRAGSMQGTTRGTAPLNSCALLSAQGGLERAHVQLCVPVRERDDFRAPIT